MLLFILVSESSSSNDIKLTDDDTEATDQEDPRNKRFSFNLRGGGGGGSGNFLFDLIRVSLLVYQRAFYKTKLDVFISRPLPITNRFLITEIHTPVYIYINTYLTNTFLPSKHKNTLTNLNDYKHTYVYMNTTVNEMISLSCITIRIIRIDFAKNQFFPFIRSTFV